ncbi:uncharacterized protein LOC124703246 isoform X2 [Lolium rigidum]|uniref:uncharacterized protein LOC124703246 isoform X2 n=1 Tax=Lolium rigidum TaxID=89674 RepID=UPI001F5CDE75|nr:uncharacterized protein LOC124703246 isoform X2 [Lolium rigidum]
MAQNIQQETTSGGMPMEDKEEEEEEEQGHGDRPLLPVYAQEQDVKPSTSLLPVNSRSMRSRAEQVKEEAPRSGIRSLSFSKLFSFRTVTSSTAMDIDQLAAEDACAEQPKQVWRSHSMPMTSMRRFPHGRRKRVVDSSSLPRFQVSSMPVPVPESSPSEAQEGAKQDEDAEEVGEEDAFCRICMVALGEGGSVLKLECHCKGELALAHRDCALKWFGIKGNANCDVCGHDVLNLPVTLRRACDDAPPPLLLPSLAAAATPGNDNGGCSGFRRHDTVILVVVSMLAYFCFLEQLLVDDHGTTALAISLPFAGVLGLFSSLTITKMVSRRYVWIYSAVQFLFIVLFTHLFYRYVQLQAVIAIILSTFLGFSVAICANTVLQIIRWRARRLPLTADSHLQAAQP